MKDENSENKAIEKKIVENPYIAFRKSHSLTCGFSEKARVAEIRANAAFHIYFFCFANIKAANKHSS